MKFTLLAAALAGLLTTADDQVLGDPQAELIVMVSCTATEMSLKHSYIQSAAVIGALSQNQQLDQIKASYQSMAADSQKRIEAYASMIDNMLIPQVAQTIGAKPADLKEGTSGVLQRMVLQSALQLGNPMTEMDEQTTMQRQLVERSQGCESLADAMQREHKV